MPDYDEIDYSQFEFDAWLKFFFEMPIRQDAAFSPFDISDPKRHLEHYLRFNEECRAILWLYKANAARTEFVFWNLNHLAADMLWLDHLPNRDSFAAYALPNHALRMQIIESLLIPYQDVYRFIADGYAGSAFFMCWHTMLDRFRAAYGRPAIKGPYEPDSEEERTERDAMLQTLLRTLAIDNLDCQLAACHGLNHLTHPRGAAAIEAFIQQKAESLDPDTLRYLYACKDGEAQ